MAPKSLEGPSRRNIFFYTEGDTLKGQLQGNTAMLTARQERGERGK